MGKQLKIRFLISAVTSLLFTVLIFMLINFPIQISSYMLNLYIFIALAAVFNAGIFAQKYFQFKKLK